MKTVQHYIEEVYSVVWNFNSYWDKKIPWKSELSENPGEVAEIICSFAKSMKASPKNHKLAKEALDQIHKYATPEDVSEKAKYKGETALKEPINKWAIERLIEACEAIIDLEKTNKDDKLLELNKNWCGKFIYFNGDEEGEQIINPRQIYYKGDDIVFDGLMIDVCNGNTQAGDGVLIYEVEGYNFDRLYYINYISVDYEEDESEDEDTISPEKLQAMLSSSPIDTDRENRLVTKEEVYEIIKANIDFSLEENLWW